MTQHDTDMTPPPFRATVEDAAKLLGVSIDAIRKRIERGTLRSEKVDGTRYVFLDADMSEKDTDRTRHDTDMTALVASMQDQIDTLKQELEDWKEQARRKDHLLAAALERIPQIEAPQEHSESPVSPPEGPSSTPPSPQEEGRSWWRRFFGL
jgi:excisionase family DNA binding protein